LERKSLGSVTAYCTNSSSAHEQHRAGNPLKTIRHPSIFRSASMPTATAAIKPLVEDADPAFGAIQHLSMEKRAQWSVST
jgi:hypothetical protein